MWTKSQFVLMPKNEKNELFRIALSFQLATCRTNASWSHVKRWNSAVLLKVLWKWCSCSFVGELAARVWRTFRRSRWCRDVDATQGKCMCCVLAAGVSIVLLQPSVIGEEDEILCLCLWHNMCKTSVYRKKLKAEGSWTDCCSGICWNVVHCRLWNNFRI